MAHIESPMFNLGCHFDNRLYLMCEYKDEGRVTGKSITMRVTGFQIQHVRQTYRLRLLALKVLHGQGKGNVEVYNYA